MELINTTTIPAELSVSEITSESSGDSVRLGTLTAKATWSVDQLGRLALAEDPLPVLQMEEPVEFGFMPRDVIPPRPAGMEVLLLAAAYAPSGRPVTEMSVALQVGGRRHELLVSGDRLWRQESDGGWVLGPPAAFTRMPLTWERAFGGSAEIWIDAHSAVEVYHHFNPRGRGFDPTPQMNGLAHQLGCPPTFPRLGSRRIAPNVESHLCRITCSEDAPEPYCWAPVPLELGLRAKWTLDSLANSPNDASADIHERLREAGGDTGIWFAHPDLRFPCPPPGTPVLLDGCTPSGRWCFLWPHLRLAYDYEVDGRTGSRSMDPQEMLILPDQGLISMVFRAWFRFVATATPGVRSVRMRIDA